MTKSKNGKNVHVGPSKNSDGWSVKKEGAQKASKIFDTKKEAEKEGRKQAKNNESELIIKGKDGKIQSKDSHGKDPFPPKG